MKKNVLHVTMIKAEKKVCLKNIIRKKNVIKSCLKVLKTVNVLKYKTMISIILCL